VRNLTRFEKETIINFNEAEDIAYIFTYYRSWQRYLEGKLGCMPVKDNGFGGKEYELPKDRIPMPRAKRRFSPEAQKRMFDRGRKMAAVRHRTPF
jgi:hypothetical protein